MVDGIVAKVTKGVNSAHVHFDPMLVGIVGSGGMMPPYHTGSANANPRIARPVAVFGTQDHGIDMARKYGVEGVYFRDGKDPDGAWKAFLDTHQLTVIAGPNHVHLPQAREAISIPFQGRDRFLYIEKPPAATLDDAVSLEQLEADNPGRIAVVAHNRLWENLLEMRHKILSGQIGDITNVEVEYQQDYQFGQASPGWRNAAGVAGEPGGVEKGNIGKLVDIAYHALDTLMFSTGRPVTGVAGAQVLTIEPEKIVGSGGPFGAGGGKDKIVVAGTDEAKEYLFDDVLYANLLLGTRKVSTKTGDLELPVGAQLKVTQTDSGYKNRLRIRVHGTKGSLEFNTDDAASLYQVDSNRGGGGPSNITKRIDLATPALEYRKTLPDWLREGLDMQTGAPFGYDTPPKHDRGWRETHKYQFQQWALYAQLVRDGVIGIDQRADLFTVPTANQAANVMRAMKAIYQAANQQQVTPVERK